MGERKVIYNKNIHSRLCNEVYVCFFFFLSVCQLFDFLLAWMYCTECQFFLLYVRVRTFFFFCTVQKLGECVSRGNPESLLSFIERLIIFSLGYTVLKNYHLKFVRTNSMPPKNPSLNLLMMQTILAIKVTRTKRKTSSKPKCQKTRLMRNQLRNEFQISVNSPFLWKRWNVSEWKLSPTLSRH